jgi:hypothetical protein
MTPPTFGDLLGKVFAHGGLIDIFFNVATLALVAMIVYGGFLRLTAAESPQGIAKANSTIFMAVIGFAIIMASALIVRVAASVLGYSTDILQINL